MKNSVLTTFAFAVASLGVMNTRSASGQNAVLSEMYGRGVHAYYAGNTTDAQKYLSMAIDNGIEDPRAYYFRGMVALSLGQPHDSDWQQGAEMEASGRTNAAIGRSLARFQGTARIELEEIRQSARLRAAANSTARSQQRYGELDAASGDVLRGAPAAATPPRPPAAAQAVTPPPAPPIADPFADDMAEGQPKVVADDALEGAMNNPFADDGAAGAAAPAAAGADPFGGAGAAGAADPFGGGTDAGGADPFGGGGAAGGADPFGGGTDAGGADPFGGGADAGSAANDPFAG